MKIDCDNSVPWITLRQGLRSVGLELCSGSNGCAHIRPMKPEQPLAVCSASGCDSKATVTLDKNHYCSVHASLRLLEQAKAVNNPWGRS
jgi:hypothetical protein